MIKQIRFCLNSIKLFFKAYLSEKKFLYKVEEINECTNRVILSCTGKLVTIITSIDELGRDEYTISLLPPHQACWLGYYYGKRWYTNQASQNGKKKKNISAPRPHHHNSIYKIIGQNRAGEIIYQNTETSQLFQEAPVKVAQSKTISRFNASQAFYIGFLSALKNLKDAERKEVKPTIQKPQLRLVK